MAIPIINRELCSLSDNVGCICLKFLMGGGRVTNRPTNVHLHGRAMQFVGVVVFISFLAITVVISSLPSASQHIGVRELYTGCPIWSLPDVSERNIGIHHGIMRTTPRDFSGFRDQRILTTPRDFSGFRDQRISGFRDQRILTTPRNPSGFEDQLPSGFEDQLDDVSQFDICDICPWICSGPPIGGMRVTP